MADTHPPVTHPPKPRLTLNVGVTGHRLDRLPPAALPALAPALSEVMTQLARAASALAEDHTTLAEAPARLCLHTPLATGADQIAADAARSAGYSVHALLPFGPDDYASDFAEGAERAAFRRQLASVDTMFALPGQRGDGAEAYVMVGRALVAAAEVLVAVWNGAASRGPGGTAHVIEIALASGVPVIHLPVDAARGTVGTARLLTEAGVDRSAASPIIGPDGFDRLVRAVVRSRRQSLISD